MLKKLINDTGKTTCCQWVWHNMTDKAQPVYKLDIIRWKTFNGFSALHLHYTM